MQIHATRNAKDEIEPVNTGTPLLKTGGSNDPQTQTPPEVNMNEQEPNSEKSEDMEQARLGRGAKRVARMLRSQSDKAEKAKARHHATKPQKPNSNSKSDEGEKFNPELWFTGGSNHSEDIEELSELDDVALEDMSNKLSDRIEAQLVKVNPHKLSPIKP